ncbi:MAG: 30S ribosome-binding factor RbfA [Limnochordia bacterium]|jgi:ribosome-binding factor A
MGIKRAARVREAMKKEIGDILQREIKDPGLGFVTLTDVEVSKDLRYVNAYVSVYGSQESKKESMEALERATGFIRTEIGKRIRLRYTPEISFHFDDSMERSERIFRILKEVAPSQEDEPK